MSKKYVPAFLKGQTQVEESVATPANTRTFGSGGAHTGSSLNTSNKFSALADDYKKPIINTSKPAMDAPKLAPATLASLTSSGAAVAGAGAGTSGPKKSFASKFAEQAKIASDPNYKPPPKPVNFSSEDDFPSLGGPKKPVAVAVAAIKPELASTATGSKFADMAKGWAKQKEDEAAAEEMRRAKEEIDRREREMMRNVGIIGLRRRQNYNEYSDEEDEDYNPNYDESSLGDDSYELPEDGEPSTDEDDENGEFNNDIGWDGRKKGDLY